MYRERYWNAQIFEAIAALSRVADDAGLPLTELALRWLRSKPVVGPTLLGGSKTSHLQANIEALSRGPLSDDLVTACDEVGAALRGPMPAYNR